MLQMKFDNKYGSDKDTQLHYCISIKYGSSNFLWEENFSKCCFYNVYIFFQKREKGGFLIMAI